MRVNNISPYQHKNYANKNFDALAKTYSPLSAPGLCLNEIPSIAFCGIPIKNSIGKVKLPEVFDDFEGELYKIKLFDKIKKKSTDAFISFHKNWSDSGEDYLCVFDKSGEPIGDLSLNYTDWKTRKVGSFENGLPRPYLSLSWIQSFENENFRGIGTTLMQAAVEKSLKTDAEGKIYSYAWNFKGQNDSFCFYNKMAMTTVEPGAVNTKIANMDTYLRRASVGLGMPANTLEPIKKSIEKFKGKSFDSMLEDEKILSIYETYAHNKPCNTADIHLDFGEFMYLHDEELQKKWLPKIEINPIFSKSNRVK